MCLFSFLLQGPEPSFQPEVASTRERAAHVPGHGGGACR